MVMIQSFFHEYSGNVTFSSDEMRILRVYLYDTNLDDANLYEDDPETIIHIGLTT